ncbi:MAG: hypothetical protein AVDCRST_MAG56-400 [uncultured Cytophagales bacterium]|uniref:Lipoprotein SmpA/OmlA domain-containing protein n=1 Tax=uncultured Cytophagales bacterium TaxID=158755 RepID=A0A6J4HE51_9SPHI|nr:MAG: hypothetical protein AVDCRST_MAG56-400 [uncultured Cytophagales bacterium]
MTRIGTFLGRLGCMAGIGLAACGSPKQIDGFDSAAWQADRLGCGGGRKALSQPFDSIRRQLKGLTQNELLDVLGKPDFQRLYQRNQKFYVYFLEPGAQCGGNADASRARTAVIRFSAIELVTEVYYDNGKPQ